MSDPISPLSEDDVRQISLLIESLDKSTFDFLQVQVGDIKVTLGKGEAPPAVAAVPVAPMGPAAPVASNPVAAALAAPPAPVRDAAAQEGTVAIPSPMVGLFYAQSEPGAPPFVKVGDRVSEGTTVALIEVMKTFTAVPAGVSGTVTEICVKNTQFVEYGQALFRVRPA